MKNNRYDRSIRFFGKKGQEKLAATQAAVVGIGGLGTHVVQQLALLGVGSLSIIDKEEIDETNLNRYIGIRHDDALPGTLKVDIGGRIVHEINPDISVEVIPSPLMSEQAFNAVIKADYVFGCLDNEGARLILNELCAAYSKPYIDLASEIFPDNTDEYGGRVCISWDGKGCIVCYDELDIAEAQADLQNPEARKDHENIYGVSKDVLGTVGPSIVSINGIIASLGVTEFLLWVTGIRKPKSLLTYRGKMGIVSSSLNSPDPDCFYCKGIWGKEDEADVQRYFREEVVL